MLQILLDFANPSTWLIPIEITTDYNETMCKISNSMAIHGSSDGGTVFRILYSKNKETADDAMRKLASAMNVFGLSCFNTNGLIEIRRKQNSIRSARFSFDEVEIIVGILFFQSTYTQGCY